MNIVILDANFLLVPSQFHLDVYREIRSVLPGNLKFLVLPEVLQELKLKSESSTSSKFKRTVEMARQLLDRYQSEKPLQFKYLDKNKPKGMYVDDYLVNIATSIAEDEESHVYIATNDRELRIKASTNGILTIYLRQKKYIKVSR